MQQQADTQKQLPARIFDEGIPAQAELDENQNDATVELSGSEVQPGVQVELGHEEQTKQAEIRSD